MKIQTKHSIHFVKSAHSTNNSDVLGISGRRLSELAFLKLPIMPSVIIDHYIAQTIGKESLSSLLQANLKAFSTEIGREYGENASPMLLNLRPSPNLHYVDCPTISYIGLTGKNIRTIQKNVGKDNGCTILFTFLDGLFNVISKIIQLETNNTKKTELKINMQKMKVFLDKRKTITDMFDVIDMYSEVFPQNFFEDVMLQLDVALRLIVQLSSLQNEEIGIVVEPIFYASDDSFCFGSCTTRNTTTGAKELDGEFFQNKVYFCKDNPKNILTLPKEYLKQLEQIGSVIETKKQEIYKMTFAISNKKLYLLDASIEAKVSVKAKIFFLLELYNQKIIKAEQVVKRIDASALSGFDWEDIQAIHSTVSNNKNDRQESHKNTIESKQIIDIATSFIKTFKVLSNAESIEDVKKAIDLKANGIGMFKTEKMLLSQEKINFLRGIFFSKDIKKSKELYKQFIEIQADEFYQLLRFLENTPITIRLLNASINDVLPVYDSEVKEFLTFMNKYNIHFNPNEFDEELIVLREMNPEVEMRGSRIWMDYPQVYETQLTAIFEAIYRLQKEKINTDVAIAIPLINYAKEIRDISFGTQLKHISYKSISAIEEEVRKKHNLEKAKYKIASIIETPSGALKASEIARYTDVFIFDAISLTEKTLSLSREDSSWISYLNSYNPHGLLSETHIGFSMDESVKELINTAVIRAGMVRSNARFTLFIDHIYGNKNMEFFMDLQGNYISCCADDVPIVLLEIAQAEIKKEETRLEERRFQK